MSTFQVTDDVYGIDVGMLDDGVCSVYLFDDEEPTLVDAGHARGAERLTDGLSDCGLAVDDLSNIVLSHIHIDHTGSTSHLVDNAPDVDVYIHEDTAPFLIDPSGLVESSKRAMGEYFDAFGEQGPVPQGNVTGVSADGHRLDIGGNTLELLPAPGHSPDHFAVWNPERRLLFAAESLGQYMPRADHWFPTASVPNFDIERLERSIDRLRRLEPEQIIFPHFGAWPGSPATAFDTAASTLHRFDEQITDRFRTTGSRAETTRFVADELLDLSPPYKPAVEAFFARLVTAGYLTYHDLD